MYDFEDYIGLILLFAILICFCFGAILYENASCNAKTENIGFPHQWSLLGRCKIEVSDGKWIPLESYYFKQE